MINGTPFDKINYRKVKDWENGCQVENGCVSNGTGSVSG
jgi:hypothetical protein